MTLPIPIHQIVIGKFMAACSFTTVAVIMTIPVWITVNYLGSPDHTVILANYIIPPLIAGGSLEVGSIRSLLTNSHDIVFVISLVISFLFLLSGFPLVLDFFSGWAPQAVVDAIASFSFLTHFESIKKGVIDLRDIIYFTALISFWLYANVVIIDAKKAS